MTWLTGWTYRKSHVVSYAAGAGTLYQKSIKVHYGAGTDNATEPMCDVYCNSHCRTDFGDIRFTTDEGSVLLDYWLESKVNSDYAIFWVEIAGDLSTVDKTIYLYYGNAGVTTTSNGANTFPTFFVDFNTYTNGNLHGQAGWSLWGGATTSLKVIDTVSVDGVKSVQNNDLPDQDEVKSFAAAVANLRLVINIKSSNVTTTHPQFNVVGVGVTFYAVMRSGANSGYAAYMNRGGAAFTSIRAITNNVWHRIELHLRDSDNKGEWNVDFGTYTAWATQYNNDWAGAALARLVISSIDGKVNGFDNIFVGKFISPEPANSTWGSEELPTLTTGKIFVIDKSNNLFRVDISGMTEEKALSIS